MPNPVDLFGAISGFGKLTMLVAIAAFGLAVAYVVRPTEQKLVLMRPVSLSAIFATLSGLLSGWMMILGERSRRHRTGACRCRSVYLGIAESLTVGFVCFGLLAAAWLLVAVGMLRRVTVAGSPSY